MATHIAFYFYVVMLALWQVSSMATHTALCFLVVMLPLWSSSLIAAHYAFCFRNIGIISVFRAASEMGARCRADKTDLTPSFFTDRVKVFLYCGPFSCVGRFI